MYIVACQNIAISSSRRYIDAQTQYDICIREIQQPISGQRLCICFQLTAKGKAVYCIPVSMKLDKKIKNPSNLGVACSFLFLRSTDDLIDGKLFQQKGPT